VVMASGKNRNAPCWCGSGKKYKKCHLSRESERSLPLKALEHVMHEAWKHKDCLHPSAAAGVCDAIVGAHSIQRSRVLQQIVDRQKHVSTFFPVRVDGTGRIRVHRVGWREASTFTGFCGKHDASTFGPIENVQFSGTKQQCFLLGYRALCHEIYQKTGALKSSPEIRRLVDRGVPPSAQREMQDLFANLAAAQGQGLSDSQKLKTAMDAQLLAGTYEGCSSAVVKFDGDLCIGCTGSMTPDHDLEGKRLQTLHDDSTPLESLLFGMAVTDAGGAAVFTWSDKEAAPRAFVDSMLKNSADQLPSILVQFMFTYIENTFFSGRWWDSLSNLHQGHLAALARISNPYYGSFQFLQSKLVPWKITNISIR
jgi:hypothetical protein